MEHAQCRQPEGESCTCAVIRPRGESCTCVLLLVNGSSVELVPEVSPEGGAQLRAVVCGSACQLSRIWLIQLLGGNSDLLCQVV